MGRKKEKHGGKADAVPAVRAATVMQFIIADLNKFNDKLFVCQADKYNWTAHLYRGTFHSEDYVVLDVYCHCYQPNWSCEASIDVQIWENTVYKFEQHYELKRNCMSCPPFIKWTDFINPANRYVHDGRVLIDIFINEIPKKVQKNSAVVFKEYPGIKNLMISVGRSKFHVNKELLAETSEYFRGELSKGNLNAEEEYHLDEISPCDFQLYMDLTYHPKQYFTSYHAKDMLATAKRFGNSEIITTCQNVLVEDLRENKLSNKDQDRLAKTYDLDTCKDLFNPEVVTRSSVRPRFMTLERFKLEERSRPDTKTKVRAVKTGLLQKHRENFRNRDELKKIEEPKVEEEEDDDVIFIKMVDHRAMQLAAREVVEEDYDMSMPSTSGCYGY